MSGITRINLRVYGILLNDAGQVLLAHERINDFHFTKFPGGGLELGEGPADCVIREFKEELDIPVEVEEHVYTTHFFQPSAFRTNDQLLSIYYKVKNMSNRQTFGEHVVKNEDVTEVSVFEWVALEKLHPDTFTFPIDKLVCDMIRKRYA